MTDPRQETIPMPDDDHGDVHVTEPPEPIAGSMDAMQDEPEDEDVNQDDDVDS